VQPARDDLPGDGLDETTGTSRRRSWLLVVAAGETLTLAALLLNLLLTERSDALAAALGPVHGRLHLTGVLLTWGGTCSRAVKLAAVVPVAGVWVATTRTGATTPAGGAERLTCLLGRSRAETKPAHVS
jgi:pheromone shutdown protein TraB